MLVRFTSAHNDETKGKPFYLNAQHIVAVGDGVDGETRIKMSDGDLYFVEESPDRVGGLANASGT